MREPSTFPLGRLDETRGWWMKHDPNGQPAVTKWKVLGPLPSRCWGREYSWLALEPVTGRTHQLRVHCAEMGWPIVGDAIYGNAPRSGGPVLHLHAREVVVPLYKNRAADPRGRAGAAAHACGARQCGWNGRAELQEPSLQGPSEASRIITAGEHPAQIVNTIRTAVGGNDLAASNCLPSWPAIVTSTIAPGSAAAASETCVKCSVRPCASASISTCRVAPTSASRCRRNARAPCSRRRAARSFTIARSSCGMRAAGVPGRGENGNTCRCVRPHSSTSVERVREHRFGLGRKAGDDIGAEHDVRAQPAQVAAECDRVARANAGASCA